MVAATEQTIVSTWLAIVYNPAKEKQQPAQWAELTGNESPHRPPAGRLLMLPIVIPKGHKPEQALEARSFFLKPGTNLGIPLEDWQAALDADKEKQRRGEIASLSLAVAKGVFTAVIPELPANDGEPGYRHFASITAIQLINQTTHEDWLDTWMEAETRAEIIKAANEHKARIIAAKKRNAA